MNFLEYADEELMMMALADRIAGDLEEVLLTHDTATLVVPGGTTPGPVFDILCGVKLDWSRVRLMLSDERWVSETSDRSNTKLLRERLLVGQASAAQFIPFFTGDETPEIGLAQVNDTIGATLPVSVLLLGMGADMHTASLFPHADGLDAALDDNAAPVVPIRGGGATEPRVSLSGPVLKSALHTHIVIKGADKRTALDNAAGKLIEAAPINLVLNHATVHWTGAA
jgi:6-phosphogluconolactonase